MSRRVITAAAIIVGFGALVAYVRAQDAATRSVLRSINDSTQEPSLASPPVSARRLQESNSSSGSSRYSIGDAEEAVSAPQTGRRMSLADRLKQVRESASQVDQRPRSGQDVASATAADAGTPANATPRNQNTSNHSRGYY